MFTVADIATLLRQIPSREELTSTAAIAFVAKPKECEVEFPFGSVQTSAPASSEDQEVEHIPKKRKSDDQDNGEPGTQIKSIPPKYSPHLPPKCYENLPNNIKFILPKNMQTKFWENKYVELSSLAVSSSTWKSRMSSFNKLKTFAKDTIQISLGP